MLPSTRDAITSPVYFPDIEEWDCTPQRDCLPETTVTPRKRNSTASADENQNPLVRATQRVRCDLPLLGLDVGVRHDASSVTPPSFSLQVPGKLEPRILCVAPEKGPGGFLALVERENGPHVNSSYALHMVVLSDSTPTGNEVATTHGENQHHFLTCRFPVQSSGRIWITNLAFIDDFIITIGARAHNKLMTWATFQDADGDCYLQRISESLSLPAYPSTMEKYGSAGRWLLIPGYEGGRQRGSKSHISGSATIMTVAILPGGPTLLNTTSDPNVRCITHIASCHQTSVAATSGESQNDDDGTIGVVTLWSIHEDGSLQVRQKINRHLAAIKALAFEKGTLVTADILCSYVWTISENAEIAPRLIATIQTPGALTSAVAILRQDIVLTAGLSGSTISVWDTSTTHDPELPASEISKIHTANCTQCLVAHNDSIYQTSQSGLTCYKRQNFVQDGSLHG